MAKLEIWRDAAGVPLVKARTERDLFYGLGVVHAWDRMLQMQVTRLLGEGRAAEHLADEPLLVSYDVKLRSLGLADDARREVDKLDSELSELLVAYCDGVNDGTVGAHRRRRPLAMRMVRLKPARWEPWHTMLILKVMAFMGLTEIQEDTERFIIEAVRRGTDPDKLKELFDPYLDGMEAELVRSLSSFCGVEARPPLAEAMAATGSNSFAVSGKRSASGRALLANDPHLPVNRLPAIWMEVMAELDGRPIIGSTLPGGPGFISARTPELAWGVTYSMADNVDFFVEDVRGDRVRRGDEWVPLTVRTEKVGRRGKPPLNVTVRESDLGVVEGEGDGRLLAFAWSGWKETGAASFRALRGLTRATSVPEAMAVVRETDIPPLNWILADRQGSVAWQLGGRYPIRRPGWSGLHPVAGWDRDNAWSGVREPAELPFLLDPEDGLVITANHNRNDEGQPPYISLPHSDCRAERIRQVLDAETVTLDTVRDAQLDLQSLQVERLLPILTPHLPEGAEKKALLAWDRRYHPDSREATLFENLWHEIVITVFGDGGLGRDWLDHLLREARLHAFLFGNFDQVLMKPDSRWLPADRRDEVLRKAAERAFARPWPPWGEVARFSFGHMLFAGALPRFLGFDRGPYPVKGSRATPSQGSLLQSHGRPFFIAPSYRTLIEMGERVTARTCLPGGPSERRFSRFYASEIESYVKGEYKTLDPAAVVRRELLVQ